MADKVVAVTIQANASEAISSVKSFKQQLREAEKEVINLSEKFGATSKEAQNAAKRAAELKDAIGDSKSLIDAFNPDQKFRALSQSLNGVLGGFTALTGAMGLLGVESEDTQKMLLKVQSAMALSQGLNQVGDAIQSFKNLGTVIQSTTIFQKANNAATVAATTIQKMFGASVVGTGRAFTILKGAIAATGIGLLIIGIGALVSKISDWTSGTDGQKKAQDSLNNSLERYNQLIDQELKGIDYVIKARKLRAQLAGASEKELSNIENEGNKERLGALENNLNRIKALRSSPEFAKADLATVEKVNKEYLAANQAYWDETNKQELDGLQKQVDARKKATTGGGGTKTKTEEVTKSIDGLSPEGSIAVSNEKAKNEMIINLRKDLNADLDIEESNNANIVKYWADKRTNEARLEAEAKIKYSELEAQAKVNAAQNTGNALNALSDLVGKETAAGKVLAIASATINTYLAASQALKANYGVGPFAQVARVAAVVSTIALGLKQVKEIVKVKVPGAAGGSAPSVSGASIQAAVTPQAAQSTRTTLDQNQLNQIGNATVRAFVLESDVTNSQTRIRRLNRAARL